VVPRPGQKLSQSCRTNLERTKLDPEGHNMIVPFLIYPSIFFVPPEKSLSSTGHFFFVALGFNVLAYS